LIFVLATVQVILYGWVLGVKRGREFAAEGAEMRQPRAFFFVIKYISPVYLLAVFVLWCVHPKNLPAYLKTLSKGGVALWTVLIMVAVTIFLTILVSLAGKRWKAEEKGKLGLDGALAREEKP
jgi:NADH:ubiquinone oxidoreductase subunit 6 (subunit J)